MGLCWWGGGTDSRGVLAVSRNYLKPDVGLGLWSTGLALVSWLVQPRRLLSAGWVTTDRWSSRQRQTHRSSHALALFCCSRSDVVHSQDGGPTRVRRALSKRRLRANAESDVSGLLSRAFLHVLHYKKLSHARGVRRQALGFRF